MIRTLRANRPTFNTVHLQPGLNVLLADRTKEETKKNSRNGLGKSTFIELLHFCLGGKFDGPVTAPELDGWSFTLELDLAGTLVSATRDTAYPNFISVEGDTSGWPNEPRTNDERGTRELSVANWNDVLGNLMFGLPVNGSGKYRPTFRALISYFIRRGRQAYVSPFEYFSRQKAYLRQVLVTYLLGLDHQDAIDFQELKDRSTKLKQLRQLTSGKSTARELLGSLGELEAKKVRLEGQVRREQTDLQSFRVHPQYEDISKEANELTESIHRITNENLIDSRLVNLYRASLGDERPPQDEEVVRLYERVGIELPGLVRRRLDEVQQFHTSLIQNRRSFLDEEINRLELVVRTRNAEIERLSSHRAELMMILESHGALNEYTLLQQKHLKTRAELDSTISKIKDLHDLRQGETALKVDGANLVSRSLRGLTERAETRDRAIEFFNANSQALYEVPGNLLIDVEDAGFSFDVAIQRSTSGGVENMKVFCFDLMLAQLWAGRPRSPGFLVHDSNIFDGVDERQRALALELAAQESNRLGFQYVCTLNSDAVPLNEFRSDFDFDEHVRIRLSDKDERSRLTGIRFEYGRDEDEPGEALDEEVSSG